MPKEETAMSKMVLSSLFRSPPITIIKSITSSQQWKSLDIMIFFLIVHDMSNDIKEEFAW